MLLRVFSQLATDKEVTESNTKSIVELTEEEREICPEVVRKLKGTSQKVNRAKILPKAGRGIMRCDIIKILQQRGVHLILEARMHL